MNASIDSGLQHPLALPAASNTMKISPPLLLLVYYLAFTQLLGCMPMAGLGTFPNGHPAYPGQPIGVYNPQPYPGGSPWHNVGYPRFPGGPGIPIVMNPAPFPGGPGIPVVVNPSPVPETTPTIPVSRPEPGPTEPNEDPAAFWSPWPLPPRAKQLAARAVGFSGAASEGVPGNDLRRQQLIQAAGPTPNEDLKYRGGRIIRDLFYVNLYVSGDTEWSTADVEQIDGSLSPAMRDEHLNNVLLQYYDNQQISSTALPSHPLVGYTPTIVTRGDIQNYVAYLHRQGFLRSYDLRNTVFNFLLPPGTVLTVAAQAANALREDINSLVRTETFETRDVVQASEEGDSRSGMGGYHGSVVTADGGRVYFSVGVYSERFANDATNGIPVFREPWKNVVATLYHQLIEARTNPDVEDAIRNSSDLNADRNLGWVSDSGLEIGDFPLHTDVPLTSVMREVPLANGRGQVPVQLPYSNFVHGIEGPISQPHPLPSR